MKERHIEQEPVVSNTLEEKLKEAILKLGDKWLLHPVHSPKKGQYNKWGRLEDAPESERRQ